MAPKKAGTDRTWKFCGERLREIRRAKGYVRGEELAERMHSEPECGGVLKEMIYRWERGEGRPGLAHALALESIFHVPVRKWYELVESPTPKR